MIILSTRRAAKGRFLLTYHFHGIILVYHFLPQFVRSRSVICLKIMDCFTEPQPVNLIIWTLIHCPHPLSSWWSEPTRAISNAPLGAWHSSQGEAFTCPSITSLYNSVKIIQVVPGTFILDGYNLQNNTIVWRFHDKDKSFKSQGGYLYPMVMWPTGLSSVSDWWSVSDVLYYANNLEWDAC